MTTNIERYFRICISVSLSIVIDYINNINIYNDIARKYGNIYICNQVVGIQHIFFIFKELFKMKNI